jgi:hypothetical protein
MPFRMIACGATFAITCIIIASYQESLVPFSILYVVGMSFCNGFTYFAPVHHSWLWFPKNTGLISGIIISGFGFGSLIFNTLTTHYINPENLKSEGGHYPDEVNERFPGMIRLLAYCYLGISLVAILLIFPGEDFKKRQDEKAKRLSSRYESPTRQFEYEDTEELADLINNAVFWQCLKSKQFWLIYIMSILSICKFCNLMRLCC